MLLCAVASAEAAGPSLKIEVVSNRADPVSTGEALVEVKIPAGFNPARVRVFDDGRDVTSAFADGNGNVVYGGRALGPSPSGSGGG
jgi:hypothetical protein